MIRSFSSLFTLSAPLVFLLSVGCGAPELPAEGKGTGGKTTGTTDSGATGGTTETTSSTGTGGDPSTGNGPAYVPARIRRLTNSEYDASVQALIGTELKPGSSFPPDTRQQGFTVNEAQRVDPVLARQLDSAATALADEVVTRIDDFAPCSDNQFANCGSSFIAEFGAKAYRRPLTEDDAASLITLFNTGMDGGDYADGIHLVVRGILQSPGFLYLTEIGEGSGSNPIVMTDHEIGASMAYLFTGAPPDDELTAAAEKGELATAEGRATQARRLLALAGGQDRAVLLVREWLGLDRIEGTAKDSNVFKDFDTYHDDINAETYAFVKEVIKTSNGDLRDLLGAQWTIATPGLATVYGATGQGRIELPDRPGLLNRAAFLSIYSHATETSPVLRGVAVLRRVTCYDIQLPTDLKVQIVPPVPDPTKTARERFDIHSQDAACRKCHAQIDPLGFSFEQFDGMGKLQTMDGNNPIDTSADTKTGNDFDGSYQSSTDLAVALANSADVSECFARFVFRGSMGEGTAAKTAEDAFISSWSQLDSEDQRSLIEILIQIATSDLSITRSQP